MGLGFSRAPRFLAATAVSLFVLSLVSCASRPLGDGDRRGDPEFRGVFVASAYNLDWPSRPGLHHVAMKDEIRAVVDRVEEMNCNVIMLQVRAFGDRIHRNTKLATPEPWAEPLNRTNDPDLSGAKKFDPLDEWIKQCHSRKIELHLWVNPFRINRLVTYNGKVLPVLVGGNGHHLYLDPSSDDVQAYVMEVINDLLDYSPAVVAAPQVRSGEFSSPVMMSVAMGEGVDGVMFDHDLPPPPPRPPPTINPPTTKPTQARMLVRSALTLETDQPTRAKWLEKSSHGPPNNVVNPAYDPLAVSRFIEKVSAAVRLRPGCLFGISPSIAGHYTADAKTWVSKGLVDYVIPEFYQEGAPGDLEAELQKWIDEADKTATKPAVIGGLATVFAQVPKDKSSDKPWPPDVIDKQIRAVKQAHGSQGRTKASGHAFYTWGSLREPKHAGPPDNIGKDTIKDKHQQNKKRPFKPRPGHP